MSAKKRPDRQQLVTPGADPTRVARVAGLRSSGAAGRHANGTRRLRTKSAAKRAAIADSMAGR